MHAASFSSHDEVVALLLYAGAQQITNKAGMTARQEAKGAAIDVYTIFETEGSSGLSLKYPKVLTLKAESQTAPSAYLPFPPFG